MKEASFTGRLLVATPALADPNFDRTVVLLLDHDEEGSLGVVVNRPTPVDVTDVLPPWSELATEPGVVFQGGPVALDSALGLAAVPGGAEPLGWRRVYVSMAREMSTSRLPCFMAAMPAHIDSSVTRDSSTSSGA